jgi:hypothetical protein
MNLQFTRIAAVLSLVLMSAQAMAIPQITQMTRTFTQNGAEGTLTAELIVSAASDLAVMTLGGGFDITCTTSSLKIVAQFSQSFNNFFGASGQIKVPNDGYKIYQIPGYQSIPVGSCGDQECSMTYRAEVKDQANGIAATLQGVGVNFQLVPSGVSSGSNTVITSICRQGVPQCCTPGCVIP